MRNKTQSIHKNHIVDRQQIISSNHVVIPTQISKLKNNDLDPPSSILKAKKSFNLLNKDLKSSETNSTATISPHLPDSGSPSRDQYGFKKNSKWISEKTFDEFHKFYASTLKRRSLKWRQLLKENHNEWPEKTSQIRRYIRKGIPSELRGQAWLHYSGAKSRKDENKQLYHYLVQETEHQGYTNENLEIIERDLYRTFPENEHFNYGNSAQKDLKIIVSLKRVLLAFSVYCPTIGYCQSLNYIVGMLLLFMTEEEAFWTTVALIEDILSPNVYDTTMEGVNLDQDVFFSFLSDQCPSIWNKLSGGKTFWECQRDNMPVYSFKITHWFLTLFIDVLPVESVLRVWDCLFYDGQVALFRVALGIFKQNEDKILLAKNSSELFQVIQDMTKCMIDCNSLIDETYLKYASTTRVDREEILKRRTVFKIRREKEKQNIQIEPKAKLFKTISVRSTVVNKTKEVCYFVGKTKSIRI